MQSRKDGAMNASPFALLMACSLLALTSQAAWLVTFSVYLSLQYPSLPASTIAGAVVAGSYLASVLLAPSASLRGLRYGLLCSAVGLACLTRSDPLAVALVAVGTGWARPSYQRLVAALRPDNMTSSRAFSIYSAVVNLGYVVGGFGADWLRLSFGWGGLFGSAACATALASLATLSIREPEATSPHGSDRPIPLGVSAWALLAAVATYFLGSAQFQTVLPLIAEHETFGGWPSLRAGSLAAVHGFAVLMLTLVQTARIGSEGSPVAVAGGIAMIGLCFVGLAGLHYPTHTIGVLLSVAVMSVGETWLSNHLQALGSRLAGLGRSAYWLAAAVGYVVSALWSIEWTTLSHRSFFLSIGAVCVLVALSVPYAFRRK